MKATGAADSWIDYWRSDTLFRPIMERTARYFFEQAKPLFGGRTDGVLLDFGCGPGYLIELLAGTAGELHGADTSPEMIAECRRKFGNRPGVFFHLLERPDSTDLSFLKGKGFSLIICLSVVQYSTASPRSKA